VAAFEIILAREIVTSHFCHVTGAIGAARLAKEEAVASGKGSTFRGLDLYKREVQVYYDQCRLCQNRCKITHARIEGTESEPSWGYMCGREPEETKKKPSDLFQPFEVRKNLFMEPHGQARSPIKTPGVTAKEEGELSITMPMALATYAHLPLWRAFFGALGVPLQMTRPTNRETTEAGISNSTAEFCFPIKIFLGHVSQAARSEDHIFVPHLIAGEKTRITVKSVFCPYVQSAPSIVRSSEVLSEALGARLLSPVIDFAMPEAINVKALH